MMWCDVMWCDVMWYDMIWYDTHHIHTHVCMYAQLTYWGRVMPISVSKLIIIGSDNGLSPERRQAIIWTDVGILLIGPLGTNLIEILIEKHMFPFKKMYLKMSSAKWGQFCLGLNVVNQHIEAETKWLPIADLFEYIFLNETLRILIQISLKFLPKCSIDNNPSLDQLRVWRQTYDEPLSEPMMALLAHVCLNYVWLNRVHTRILLIWHHLPVRCSSKQRSSVVLFPTENPLLQSLNSGVIPDAFFINWS